MSSKTLKVAAVQMCSGTQIEANLEQAAYLISEAKEQGAQLVVLPEFFAIMGQKETDKLALIETDGKGQVQSFLQQQAVANQIWIVGGTHAVDSGIADKPFSTCFVYSPDGNVATKYNKIHLFDVNVDDNTGNYCESRYATSGSSISHFDINNFNVGLSVCYDLRFPELYRQLSLAGCQIFCIPAAFTARTGEAHWETLLKARAIENQVYVIAAAQAGKHENGRLTWGQSCIISPWGEILAQQAEGTGVVSCDIDMSYLEKLRDEFPVLSHTRL